MLYNFLSLLHKLCRHCIVKGMLAIFFNNLVFCDFSFAYLWLINYLLDKSYYKYKLKRNQNNFINV